MRQQIGWSVVNLRRPAELDIAPPTGPKSNDAHTRSRGRFNIVGRVAYHHEFVGWNPALVDRRTNDIGIGLGSLGVAGSRAVFHQILDLCRFEKGLELLVLGRSSDDGCEAIFANAKYKRARSGEGLEMRQIFLAKNLRPSLRQPPALFTVRFDVRGFGKELVAAHPDQRSYNIERHVVPSFRERVHPGLRVRVIAVYERAVDIENYALKQKPTAACSGSIPLVSGVPGSLVLLSGSGS
jgi:hypothetical protein